MDYIYSRALLTAGKHNINHPDRLDAQGNQIFLAKEVESAIPGKAFILRCESTVATFSFDAELTNTEKLALDSTVNDHVNNA